MEYYTATEAMKRLGISSSSFYRLVSEGKIARLTLPGRRQSLYRKEDIENFAESLERVQHSTRMNKQNSPIHVLQGLLGIFS